MSAAWTGRCARGAVVAAALICQCLLAGCGGETSGSSSISSSGSSSSSSSSSSSDIQKKVSTEVRDEVAAAGKADDNRSPKPPLVSPRRVGVYVMLPLFFVGNDGTLNGDVDRWLATIKETGADGFMVHVWWGLTERTSQVYDFTPYQQLVEKAFALDLKVQVVTSFHKCGGDFGGECSIPLPEFVTNNTGIWYTDKRGQENQEYVSLWADAVELKDGRTPLQMYSQWFEALNTTFAASFGKTIVELQIGLGPSGELSYPSSYAPNGWTYPGIGEFQCYDKHALKSLADTAPAGSAFGSPPEHLGDYNSKPTDESASFFSKGFSTDEGKHFLQWYSNSLLGHADRVLSEARRVFPSFPLAAKVSCIHWWYGYPSHPAEITAGYYNANFNDAYLAIAQALKKHKTALDFTCLEMRNREQIGAQNSPETLVSQVIHATMESGVDLNGENALPRYDETAYEQIEHYKYALSSFTYSRPSDALRDSGSTAFTDFVARMHGERVGQASPEGRLKR